MADGLVPSPLEGVSILCRLSPMVWFDSPWSVVYALLPSGCLWAAAMDQMMVSPKATLRHEPCCLRAAVFGFWCIIYGLWCMVYG